MILAAGRGERMQPLTDRRAKPTLPILDEALVVRLIRQLAEQGVDSVVVNLHAHAATLERALEAAPLPVTLSPEPELLGSGGGIRAARPLLEGDAPFLVLNGDMALDLDVAALLAAHRRAGALATLALRDDDRKHRFGTIGYDAQQAVCRITDRVSVRAEKGNALFIGVHILEPTVFDHMPPAPVFGIMDHVYRPLLERGDRLQAWLQPADAAWWPVGSPAELIEANLLALERRLSGDAPSGDAEGGGASGVLLSPDAELRGEVRGPAFVGAGARIEIGARVGPHAVIGAGSRVPAGWQLRESVWLPRAAPAQTEPRSLRGAVAYDDRVWCDG
jgi:mannose-1-phosphate guanylyltransferase